MDLRLLGLRALVTGASRGLGYATAQVLGQEGCHIALNSRSQENASRAATTISQDTGTQAVAIAGDLRQEQTAKNLVDQTIIELGGLDLLVTNSSGPPAGRFEDFSDEDWRQAVELVFLSHVRLIRAALPYLRQSAHASVLTITSYSVKQPIPNLVLSNSIRSATVNLTKSLALELGSDGIRFNSILPGWTKTERVQELMLHRAKLNATDIETEYAKQASASPFGRMAEAGEFANVAVFLLSPAASYLTGVMVNVDGGMYKGTL